jgi:hypothetical protein
MSGRRINDAPSYGLEFGTHARTEALARTHARACVRTHVRMHGYVLYARPTHARRYVFTEPRIRRTHYYQEAIDEGTAS